MVLARRVGLVDRPDPSRKLHGRTIPLGGGVAVFAASVIACGVAAIFYDMMGTQGLVSFLVASCILLLVGLTDDHQSLRGRQKLVGQIFAVGILIYSGLTIERVQVFDWNIDLGILAIPFTAFWLLGAINSLNLLDGADGFASTIGIVICGAIAILATIAGHPMEAMISTAIMGALLGFLVYNFPPASIFLGDAGSMLIGLAVGVLAIRSSLKGPATVALAAPMAVMAIPIFDSFVAIVRRWLTGRSLYQTDRGHLHHNLERSGFGPRASLAGIAVLCAGTAFGAFLCVAAQNERAAFISVGVVIGILVTSKIFGFNELVLASQRAIAIGSSLVSKSGGRPRQETVRLQGSRDWDELWSSLTDFAELHQLTRVRLDLNLSWLHEGYHAVWRRDEQRDSNQLWLVRVPLSVGGRQLGRLEMTGIGVSEGHHLFPLVSELLDSIQPCIERLSEDLTQTAGSRAGELIRHEDSVIT